MTIRQAYEAIARDRLRKHDIQLTGASMTFDEWWVEGEYQLEHSLKASARTVRNAATEVERERCARVVDGTERPDERYWSELSLYGFMRRETAAEIRREP